MIKKRATQPRKKKTILPETSPPNAPMPTRHKPFTDTPPDPFTWVDNAPDETEADRKAILEMIARDEAESESLAEKQYRAAVEEYTKQWPQHCSYCGGTGIKEGQLCIVCLAPTPESARYWKLDSTEPHCPRCRGTAIETNIEQRKDLSVDEIIFECTLCGWVLGETEGRP